MRFLFRWAYRLLILLIVLAIGLFLTKDALAKWWIVSEFREHGMDAKIGQLEIGFPLNSTVSASDITIYNLPEYGGSPRRPRSSSRRSTAGCRPRSSARPSCSPPSMTTPRRTLPRAAHPHSC